MEGTGYFWGAFRQEHTMKTSHTLLLSLLLLTLTARLSGQSFPGFNLDNYAGIPGLLLNPANAAGGPVGFEIHLASGSAGFENDYTALGKFGDYDLETLDWDSDFVRNPKPDNSLYLNTDVVGPSLFFGLGRKAGLGLVTRLRSLYDMRNFDGRMLEGIQNEFQDLSGFSTTFEGFGSNTHVWGEISAVLGVVLLDRGGVTLKGGVSVKHLTGVGGTYAYSDRVEVDYVTETDHLRTGGDITYGSFGLGDDIELDPSYFREAAGSGFGFDLGLALEWRPGVARDSVYTPYRLKVAASLVDLGAVTYPDVLRTNYLLDGSVPVSDVEGSTLGYILEDYYDGAGQVEELSFGLPTTLYLHVDYRLAGKLYVSALSATALAGNGTAPGNRIRNALTVAPRLETKWLGLYAPVRFGGEQGTALGVGVRLGFVTLGSGTLVSHLLSDTNYALDAYASIRIPFLRRHAKRGNKIPAEGPKGG